MLRRFRLAHLIARIPAIAFAILLSALVIASPRQREKGFDVAAEYLSRADSLGIALPKGKNDVVIFARFSPGKLDLIAQTRNLQKTFELACVIESALYELPNKKVEYSASGLFGMVRVRRDNARLFARYAEQELPVNRLYRELAQKGWRPQIVVEVRDAKPLKTEPAPDRILGKYRYWITRSQVKAKDIHAEEAVPATSYLTILLSPFSLALMLWAGVSTTKRKKQPTFTKAMLPFLLKIAGALVLLAIAGISLSSSSPEDNYVLADAWINPAGVAIIVVIITTTAIVGFFGWLFYSLRPQLDLPFGANAGQKDRKKQVERTQQRALLQSMIVSSLLFGLLLFLVFTMASPGSLSELRSIARWVMRLGLVGFLGFGWMYWCKLIRKWSPMIADEEQARAQDLADCAAEDLGCPAPLTKVSAEGEDNLVIEAYYDAKGRLVVTRGALLDLTDRELRALILQEMSTKSLETPELAHKIANERRLVILLITAVALLTFILTSSLPLILGFFAVVYGFLRYGRSSKYRYQHDTDAFAKSLLIEPDPQVWKELMTKQSHASCLLLSSATKLPAKQYASRAELMKPLLEKADKLS